MRQNDTKRGLRTVKSDGRRRIFQTQVIVSNNAMDRDEKKSVEAYGKYIFIVIDSIVSSSIVAIAVIKLRYKLRYIDTLLSIVSSIILSLASHLSHT